MIEWLRDYGWVILLAYMLTLAAYFIGEARGKERVRREIRRQMRGDS